MAVSGKSLEKHIIEHEILGIGTHGGSTPQVDGDILWIYDETRAKWLSSFRFTPSAGRKGRAKNIYLRVYEGQATNLSGFRLPRNATITSVIAQTTNSETWILRIRKNGSATDIASLTMTAADGNHDNTIDVDLTEGDQVQFFAETSTFFGIRDPLVWVEIAWRNDTL